MFEATSEQAIEERAATYRDPVQRLHYLRHVRVVSPGRKRSVFRFRRLAPVPLLVLLLLPIPTVSDVALMEDVVALEPEASPADVTMPQVWLVEQTAEYELHSNGLRIDIRHTVDGEKRPYPVYERETLRLVEWRTDKVGIVYHTTESNTAPFDPGYNRRLQRIGEWLLEYVRHNHAYHYLIDRFGRVHRLVRDSDVANHAGYSIWADGDKVYVNLNPSFVGVSFETQTTDTAAGPAINEAQVRAAAVLTEMLRARHGIKARNCVTHAQASVAPPIMRLGNHLDWAAGFPFGRLGLTQNYGIANPAVGVFGFRYDPDFLKATGRDLWKGVLLGEDEFRRHAAERGRTVAQHREAMKKRYREIIEALEDVVEAVEKTT